MKPHSRDIDQSDLVNRAEEQGFKVETTRKGWRVLARDGKGMAHLHRTPGDHRAFKNSKSDLRRIGVQL
jgi:hypothetical protein